MTTISELRSFRMADAVKFHKDLNPKLFADLKMIPKVRKQLLLIADDFLTELGISNLDVKDITVSGSSAAYSYTPHSDLDLHLIVDMQQFSNNDVYKELFNAKKTVYNDTHDISIKGIPIELYVQDSEQEHTSLGEYSVLKDKWVKFPSKRKANFDQTTTKAKYDQLQELIDLAFKTKDLERVKKVIDIIKRYRKAGLQKEGEFGPENLAYKALRSQGVIQKLFDLKNKLHSEKLSIESVLEQLDKPTPNPTAIAKKHGVSVKHITDQLAKGIKVELEHTSNKNTATEIALDHLNEDPDYYTKLAKANLEESNEAETIQVPAGPKTRVTYDAPRYLYHSLRGRELNRNGDIQGYPLSSRERELEREFDQPSKDGYVWLSPYPYTEEAYKIDASKLDPKNLRYTGQVEGFLIHRGSIPKEAIVSQIEEGASGYIPSKSQAKDPRFKTALTVDIKPDTLQKNAKKLGWKISRAGIPPLLRK